MSNPIARVLIFALPMILASLVQAETVRNLYSAQVPVAGQDSQSLAVASQAAMAEVLVKVSGSTDVLGYPEIKTALAGARKQVQQYSYSRDLGSESGLSARFQFDDAYISGLVTTAGAPLWTANRPQVLLWLVYEDEAGRRFVSSEADPELVTQVAREFSRRGVPFKMPLFDLADSAALSTDQAWQLEADAVQLASERYDVQEILVGRLALDVSGQVSGDWRYLSGEEYSERNSSAVETAVFLQQGVAMVAEDLASRYAVAASGNSFGGVTMRVSGVSNYADYAGIVSWLERLELIEHANVERISGEQIELRLQTQADAAQLVSLIELNDRLQPLTADESASPVIPGQALPPVNTLPPVDAGQALPPVDAGQAPPPATADTELNYRCLD